MDSGKCSSDNPPMPNHEEESIIRADEGSRRFCQSAKVLRRKSRALDFIASRRDTFKHNVQDLSFEQVSSYTIQILLGTSLKL